MDPITREEKLMAGEQLEPITRKEMFLAKAAGMDIKTPEPITREEMFISMISGGGTGGSGGGGSIPSVSPKAVNFYDYDGTCLYAYTVEEAQALTEMPPLPEREGLICQGWNWTLEDVKAHNRAVNVGATYITDDGTTRIYITLQEGRTSPMLGICPNGTVTVDWGDGTEPDVLTGTSVETVQWTPNHNYAEPGDYVIRLTVDGNAKIGGYSWFLGASSNSDARNESYCNSIKKVEIGPNAIIGQNSFNQCFSMKSITIPDGTEFIGMYNFNKCYSLRFLVMPNSIKGVQPYLCNYCHTLQSVIIPSNLTTVGNSALYSCFSLSFITMPNGVKSLGTNVFYGCCGLTFVVIPNTLTSISSRAFDTCKGVKCYDFTSHTAVPTLSNTNAFSGIPSDCEIRVPAALYDEWIAATNWATYASKIVAV